MKAWSLSSQIKIAAMASRAPHFIWDSTWLSCLDGTSEHIFDLSLFWLMTCRASFFIACDIQGPVARRGPNIPFQKPEIHVPLRDGNFCEEVVLPCGFSLPLLWAFGQSSQSGEGGECRDRKVMSHRLVSQSITWQCLNFVRVQTDNFLIASSCLLYPQTVLPCVFIFLFYFNGIALQLFLPSDSIWKHSYQ